MHFFPDVDAWVIANDQMDLIPKTDKTSLSPHAFRNLRGLSAKRDRPESQKDCNPMETPYISVVRDFACLAGLPALGPQEHAKSG
jgi:hypothetical protein